MLCTKGLHQSTVNITVNIIRDNIVNQGIRAGENIKGLIVCGNRQLNKYRMKLIQGKKLFLLTFHFQRILHSGENDMQFVNLLILEKFHHFPGNHTGSVQGRILGGVMKGLFNGNVSAVKIASSHLSYHKKPIISILRQKLFRFPDDIVVISSCQSLIRGHTDNGYRSLTVGYALSKIQIRVGIVLRQMSHNSGHHRLQGIKVRLGLYQTCSGLTHLCTGNQIHRIGNLHGIINAVDSVS